MIIHIPQKTPYLTWNKKDSSTWVFPQDAFHHAFSAVEIQVYYSYKQRCITDFTHNRHKILAVVILFHRASDLPIKFPKFGDIMNEEEDLEDVWFYVVIARGFLRNCTWLLKKSARP